MIKINFVEAEHGDCFLISYKDKNILIDGGTSATYNNRLKQLLEDVNNIDLLIVTHVDSDHIGGILEFFEANEFDYSKISNIWFNSGAILGDEYKEKREFEINISSTQKTIEHGITLEKRLTELNIWKKEKILNGTQLYLDDMKITVLAPFDKDLEKLNEEWNNELERLKAEEEDQKRKKGQPKKTDENINNLLKEGTLSTSFTNKSSIAILIEIGEKKLLFSGDTSSQNLEKSLKMLGYSKDNPIKLDLFKLPHHGSKNNLGTKLVKMVDCNKYLISTDGTHNHPDKETLAKLIHYNKDKEVELIFNYINTSKSMFSKEDYKEYPKFSCSEESIIEILGEEI